MSLMDRLMPLLVPLLRGVIDTTQKARRSQFATLPAAGDHVLFLGDSITEQGIWNEWFPELKTLNRGIGGEAIGQVLTRLDTAIAEPRAISLLIGTNDLSGLGKSRDVVNIAMQMRALTAEIRRRALHAPLFINSVLPRSALYRDRIVALNEHYARIAAEFGGIYLDVWSLLADWNGVIRAEYTSDGIHLTGAGYRVWTDLLRSHLQTFSG